jgi:hypothetical protein
VGRDLLLGVARVVAGVAEHLGRVPVVQDLVIVPLRHHRHLGVEAAEVRVAEVVAVAAAELAERLCHLADAVLDEVAPRRSVVEADRLRDRPVGVDEIAGVDEEVRLDGAHRGERLHAAVGFVQAPPLATDVAAPDDLDRSRCPGRRPEGAADRLAERAPGGFEARLVDDPLSRRQAGEVEPGGEVGVGRRRRRDPLARAGQRVGGGVADAQPGRPVRPAPDDGAIGLDVAALDAGGDDRPGRGVAAHGRGGLRQQGGGRRQLEEAAAGER